MHPFSDYTGKMGLTFNFNLGKVLFTITFK